MRNLVTSQEVHYVMQEGRKTVQTAEQKIFGKLWSATSSG